MNRHGHKGQSTFEYIILVAGVIAVVVAFASSSFFQQSVNEVITNGINQLAKETEGVNFDIPDSTLDFFTPPPTQGTPPEGWEPAQIYCTGTSNNLIIDYLGEDENGLPIFSDEYVGNYCADQGGFDYPSRFGELSFDHQGNLMIGNLQGDWIPFEWNNAAHAHWAYNWQRYGPYWSWGCGVGGHWPDFTHAWQMAFGEPGSCADVMDHYYGHTYAAFEGLTGEFAMYNGHTLVDAAFMANVINNLGNPQSTGYMGTPADPAPAFDGWDLQDWLTFYNRAVQVGVAHHLPFTLQDICNAFPGESCP
jgi:hypothetical protein